MVIGVVVVVISNMVDDGGGGWGCRGGGCGGLWPLDSVDVPTHATSTKLGFS